MSGDHSSTNQNAPETHTSLTRKAKNDISGTETPLSHSDTINDGDNPSLLVDNGYLERSPTADEELPSTVEVQRTTTEPGPLHSVFSRNQKLFIIFMASWAGFFSPVSGQIYFPALNALSKDLNVSDSLINLTLTSYMVRRF